MEEYFSWNTLMMQICSNASILYIQRQSFIIVKTIKDMITKSQKWNSRQMLHPKDIKSKTKSDFAQDQAMLRMLFTYLLIQNFWNTKFAIISTTLTEIEILNNNLNQNQNSAQLKTSRKLVATRSSATLINIISFQIKCSTCPILIPSFCSSFRRKRPTKFVGSLRRASN